MPDTFYEKDDYRAIGMSPGDWVKVTNSDGSRTYTSTSDTASASVKFSGQHPDQNHEVMKIGSTITRHKDGSVEITEKM